MRLPLLFGNAREGNPQDERRSSAWVFLLRATLLFTNSLLLLVGLAILCYAAFAYAEFHRAVAPPHKGGVPYPWFIVATAGTGATTVLTAAAGLLAGCTAHSLALNLYSVMLAAMLLGQMGFALVVCVDKGWRKWPPDPSGEYDKLREWVQRNESLCMWLGMGLLAFQVFAVAVSCALSSTAQQLEEESDEEDGTSWSAAATTPASPLLGGGMRSPSSQQQRQGSTWLGGSRAPSPSAAAGGSGTSPLRSGAGSGAGVGGSLLVGARSPSGRAAAEQMAALGRRRDDAWSRRMREKYGLDTSAFTYDPSAYASGGDGGGLGGRSRSTTDGGQGGGGGGSSCVVM